jgi:hypothetical protein
MIHINILETTQYQEFLKVYHAWEERRMNEDQDCKHHWSASTREHKSFCPLCFDEQLTPAEQDTWLNREESLWEQEQVRMLKDEVQEPHTCSLNFICALAYLDQDSKTCIHDNLTKDCPTCNPEHCAYCPEHDEQECPF